MFSNVFHEAIKNRARREEYNFVIVNSDDVAIDCRRRRRKDSAVYYLIEIILTWSSHFAPILKIVFSILYLLPSMDCTVRIRTNLDVLAV